MVVSGLLISKEDKPQYANLFYTSSYIKLAQTPMSKAKYKVRLEFNQWTSRVAGSSCEILRSSFPLRKFCSLSTVTPNQLTAQIYSFPYLRILRSHPTLSSNPHVEQTFEMSSSSRKLSTESKNYLIFMGKHLAGKWIS